MTTHGLPETIERHRVKSMLRKREKRAEERRPLKMQDTCAVYTKKINSRIDYLMWEELKAQAKRNKTTICELVRTYIEWGLEDGLVSNDRRQT